MNESILFVMDEINESRIPESSHNIIVYRNSFQKYEHTKIIMVKHEGEKYLLVTGKSNLLIELNGEEVSDDKKVCQLTHNNRKVLNNYFEYTNHISS